MQGTLLGIIFAIVTCLVIAVATIAVVFNLNMEKKFRDKNEQAASHFAAAAPTTKEQFQKYYGKRPANLDTGKFETLKPTTTKVT